jgi:hypothetical protein
MGPMGSIAWEQAMKIQEVILRAMAKRITWWQAEEIIGISDRPAVAGGAGTGDAKNRIRRNLGPALWPA